MFTKIKEYIQNKFTKKEEDKLDLDSLYVCNICDFKISKWFSPRLRKDVNRTTPTSRENNRLYIARLLSVAEKERYIKEKYGENKPEYLFFDPTISFYEIVDTKAKIPDVSDKLLLSKLQEGVYTSVTNLKLLKNLQIDVNLSDVKSIEKSLNENQHTLD